MRAAGVGWWGIEEGFVWGAGLHRFCHPVEYLQYNTFCAIFTVLLYVLALDYWECVHYVVNVVTVDTVKVKKRSVELASEEESSLLVPFEHRTVVPAVFGKGFKNPAAEPTDTIGNTYRLTGYVFLIFKHIQKLSRTCISTLSNFTDNLAAIAYNIQSTYMP